MLTGSATALPVSFICDCIDSGVDYCWGLFYTSALVLATDIA
jgi:hypothetical protein